eukprot:CAMPEP_0174959750 /NCGR_PEP_ID=MMETSP0004_2-20121128/3347_1 /TAXON_ID=420556 /ORGANISM="Ochromonas sp., Strain CCMP1393" /LENGTH=521 /DNA_ID=CAMNT_0016208097 /DNA_START=24 /DNA_END=1586 /DNA_ORIENTATION=-
MELRILEQTPAWTLHAYLRILGLNYNTERLLSFTALGQRLPLLVDGFEAKSEEVALRYLLLRYGNTSAEMSTEAVFSCYLKQSLVAPYAQIKRVVGAQKDDCRRSLPFGLNLAVCFLLDLQEFFASSRLDLVPGASDAELIEQLCAVYKELNHTLLEKIIHEKPPTFTQLYDQGGAEGRDANIDWHSVGSTGSGSSIDSSGSGGDGLGATGHPPPGDIQLRSEGARKRNISQGNAGIAEAILFGHMADVLCTNDQIAEILMEHQGLMQFFQYISSLYFAVPYAAAKTAATLLLQSAPTGSDSISTSANAAIRSSDDKNNSNNNINNNLQSWKMSLEELLCNPFISHDNKCHCAQVRACLLQGTTILVPVAPSADAHPNPTPTPISSAPATMSTETSSHNHQKANAMATSSAAAGATDGGGGGGGGGAIPGSDACTRSDDSGAAILSTHTVGAGSATATATASTNRSSRSYSEADFQVHDEPTQISNVNIDLSISWLSGTGNRINDSDNNKNVTLTAGGAGF